ncbi:MAG: hypothetical protein JEZ07_16955 [Phycisphaerae bacterium]|nr:hypothetical protein [Phycisphaerae bacterium]
MHLTTRYLRKDQFVEVYISAIPDRTKELPARAAELFEAVASELKKENMFIFQERIFGTREALNAIKDIRKKAYGDLIDTVEPSWLKVPAGINGEIAGIQMHAIAGIDKPEIVEINGTPCGRIAKTDDVSFLAVSNVLPDKITSPADQSGQMFNKVNSLLTEHDKNFFSVARTWLWLGDILDWYDNLNCVRNDFFKVNNLLGPGITGRMPASTGIGIGPATDATCCMDLVAVLAPEKAIDYLDIAGNQNSAFDYGSAFSRASIAPTPAGKALYISGTASIDKDGKTTNIDDYKAQIAETIENVKALILQGDCSDEDVAQAICYCKTAEIEQYFCDNYPNFPWPHFTAVADVCRDDLLFEIEALVIKK